MTSPPEPPPPSKGPRIERWLLAAVVLWITGRAALGMFDPLDTYRDELTRGDEALLTGRAEEALELYDGLVAHLDSIAALPTRWAKHERPRTALRQGLARAALGQGDLARDHFRTALELEPNTSLPWYLGSAGRRPFLEFRSAWTQEHLPTGESNPYLARLADLEWTAERLLNAESPHSRHRLQATDIDAPALNEPETDGRFQRADAFLEMERIHADLPADYDARPWSRSPGRPDLVGMVRTELRYPAIGGPVRLILDNPTQEEWLVVLEDLPTAAFHLHPGEWRPVPVDEFARPGKYQPSQLPLGPKTLDLRLYRITRPEAWIEDPDTPQFEAEFGLIEHLLLDLPPDRSTLIYCIGGLNRYRLVTP